MTILRPFLSIHSIRLLILHVAGRRYYRETCPVRFSDFTSAMENCPDGRLSGLLNRGKTKYLLGDLSGAIADLTEAIPLERAGPVFAPLFRGRARLAAGDYEGAISDFTVAINGFPRLTNAYRHRAEAKTLAGDQKGADDDLMRYNELGGRDLPAYA